MSQHGKGIAFGRNIHGGHERRGLGAAMSDIAMADAVRATCRSTNGSTRTSRGRQRIDIGTFQQIRQAFFQLKLLLLLLFLFFDCLHCILWFVAWLLA